MDIVIYIVVAIVCLAVGFLISRVMIKNNANSAISVAEAKVADAKREAETIKKEAAIEAKDEALKIKQKAEDEALARERRIQNATLAIKKKYGKNALFKGMNLEEGATAKERNAQIGGHKA